MSIFTNSLVSELRKDGNFEKNINEISRETIKSVTENTVNKQIPWASSTLAGDYILYSDLSKRISDSFKNMILESKKLNKKNKIETEIIP